MDRRQQVARGDWQTPAALADHVVRTLARHIARPAAIVEPTCGVGSFLAAAASTYPSAILHGHDIDADHLKLSATAAPRAHLHHGDFFTTDWAATLRSLPAPVLLLGNLPWVTSAALGALAAANRPARHNPKQLRGLDARTGRSNFDISESMLRTLLAALGDQPAVVAFLCKTTVARAVVHHIATDALPVAPLGLWHFDAMAHFGAAVDAVLFACTVNHAPRPHAPWKIYADLDESTPARALAVVDGLLVHDLDTYHRTRALAGTCVPTWRSGVKHDCAPVFELSRPHGAHRWHNALDESLELEPDHVYPLLKSSDIAHGRAPHRAVLVPQRALGEDTGPLQRTAPATWNYLERHAARLAARKSSIYRNQPPFAVFGVGEYTFAPWKVAISGFYKTLEFSLVGPVDGRPVVFDDTCYFLPFAAEADARAAWTALRSPLAREFLTSRVFWAAKRPIHKALLQSLDLGALQRALAAAPT